MKKLRDINVFINIRRKTAASSDSGKKKTTAVLGKAVLGTMVLGKG